MKMKCPHCGKSFESDVMKKLGSMTSEKKALAARLNGVRGGAPMKAHPKVLRPWHPQHPRHAEYLREKMEKARLAVQPLPSNI